VRLLREIAGHRQIIQTLINSVLHDHVVHAYLFAGPAGVGKTTTALAFARALLCAHPVAGDACGNCRSCRQVAGGNHPDLFLLKPAGASIKIEQVRGMLRRVTYRSYQGGRKVFIISPADTMTAEAANCLLKTLEEPPGDTVFILLTSQPQALLPTVLSRCQQYSFKGIPLPELSEGLVRLHGLDKSEAGLYAVRAGGSMGKALAYATGTLKEEQDLVLDLAVELPGAGVVEALNKAGRLAEDRDKVSGVLAFLKCWYRDLLVFAATGEPELLYNQEHLAAVTREAGRIPSPRLLKIVAAIEAAEKKIEAYANTRLALEVLFLQIATGAGCRAEPATEEEFRSGL
jgi:DNA polymerase-3 subunit delta'